MDMRLKIALVVGLSVLIMYLIRKLVESVLNLKTIIGASKNVNHEANAESSEVVYNTETKKFENCDNITKLPF